MKVILRGKRISNFIDPAAAANNGSATQTVDSATVRILNSKDKSCKDYVMRLRDPGKPWK